MFCLFIPVRSPALRSPRSGTPRRHLITPIPGMSVNLFLSSLLVVFLFLILSSFMNMVHILKTCWFSFSRLFHIYCIKLETATRRGHILLNMNGVLQSYRKQLCIPLCSHWTSSTHKKNGVDFAFLKQIHLQIKLQISL